MTDLKISVGNVYKILKISRQCNWHTEKNLFEGKLMRCVEIFEEDKSAGFVFANESDCPKIYDGTMAFDFTNPLLRLIPSTIKASQYQT